jgi:hypothetical protein
MYGSCNLSFAGTNCSKLRPILTCSPSVCNLRRWELFWNGTEATMSTTLSTSSFQVGDHDYYCSCMQLIDHEKGQLTSPSLSAEGQLKPEQLFFSGSGRIGVIIDIEAKLALQLTALQRNMAAVISGIGGVNHARFVWCLYYTMLSPPVRLDFGHPGLQEESMTQRWLLLDFSMETS